MNYQRIVQNIIVTVIVIIFFVSVGGGFKAGRNIARTRSTATNVEALQRGLNLFYQDQNRFPTTNEFQNAELMKNYFVHFPPISFTDKTCNQSFSYSTYRQLSFSIEFCLPRSYGGFNKGQNTVTEKTPFSKE